MEKIIPAYISREDFNGSFEEEQIHEILQSLSDGYIIFHSVRWRKKDRRGHVK
jgi:hypothetical protein